MKFEFENLGTVEIELLSGKNPKTVEKLVEHLPLEGRARKWGKEIYFSVGVSIEEENFQEVVQKGSVAFWPSGNAICIFFGPTPVSTDERPKAAGPVNVFGKVSQITKFERIKSGEKVRVVA